MANPVKFEGMNKTFVAPDCYDLPALIQPYTMGNEQTFDVVTAWQLSAEEMKQVVERGGVVFLRVVGCQPPVEVTGFNPIRE